MALPINQTDGFVSITCTGGETNLDYDFPIYEKAHLRIIRTRSGTDTDLVLDTDYTIANDQLEDQTGGTAVLSVAALAGDVYSLLLNVAEERTTDFTNAGDFKAETLNRELDLQTQMIQALRRDTDKSARLPDSSALTELFLPAPDAGKVLGWNATEDGLENKTNVATLSLGTGVDTFLTTPTSTNLRAAVTDETGTGSLVFATSPTFAGTANFIAVGLDGLLNLSSANAGQIRFPATQNPSADANTLDDYEEGVFTPVITFSTPGNLSVSYSIQTGQYTKIGKSVTCNFTIFTSSFTHTTASGNLQITGFPFTSASLADHINEGALAFSGITKASYTQFTVSLGQANNVATINASGSGVGRVSVTAADMPTGGTVQFLGSVTYQASA